MINKNETVEEYVSEYAHESVRLYMYLLVGFLVPFTLGHPQELVGIVVNATLILGALELSSLKHITPLIFAPSIAVLARGLIFGPFTPFLVIMLPFIWIGNALLVWGIHEFNKKREINYGITSGAFSLAKSGFLFSIAFLLVSLAMLPPPFLAAMGITQLITAVAGGMLAFGLHKSGITRLARV